MRAAIVVAAALALAPAVAQAGTISAANGRLAFSAVAGERNDVTVIAADGSFTVKDAGSALTAGPGCSAAADGGAVCAGPLSVIEADLGDMDDAFSVSASVPAQVSGRTGNDTLRGGSGEDVLRGDEGDDTLEAGDGNDTLISAGGNDTLDGGAGDDSLQSGDGSDSLTGGEGNDTLTAKGGNDALAGGDGNDRLEGGKGVDTLDGGAGNDVLQTAEGEFTGTREKRIRCGPGDDSLTEGPADPFVSDCERVDGASLRLRKGGLIPMQLVCAAACKGTVVVRDAKNNINAKARVNLAAGKTAIVQVRLTASEIARLFKQKKARLTARFDLSSGGARQQSRATFTLLRRV